MVFNERTDYRVIERIRDLVAISPQVEEEFQNNNQLLIKHIPAFEVVHSQGYEVILLASGVHVVHMLRERPLITERVVLVGQRPHEVNELNFRLGNMFGEERFSQSIKGGTVVGRLLMKTLTPDQLLGREHPSKIR